MANLTNKLDKMERDAAAAEAAQQTAADLAWSTKKVGNTGKTQAQLDAAANAANVAASTGGTVDAAGHVIPPVKKVADTKVADPNANKEGFYLDSKSGKWIAEPQRPVGVSSLYTFNPATGQYEQPAQPAGNGPWEWDNTKGWITTTVNPGATGFQNVAGASGATNERTLAKDTFKNTLALLFGAAEMSQPWVDAVYASVSSFYKTGSTIDEAINFSIQDVRNNPSMKPFTDRFSGVYALTDRLAAGEAITVPTVAEYFKSEADMGNILRDAGMGELATQKFLGDVIGRGKSVLEVSNLISGAFNAIDNAPEALKKTLSTYFPTLSRVDLATAMLTGKDGAAALTKKVKDISVLSAAGTQGVTIDLATAGDLANQGYDYQGALQGFGTVKQLERGNTLAQMQGSTFTQGQAQSLIFGKDQAATEQARLISEREQAKFGAKSGLAQSALRGKASSTVV